MNPHGKESDGLAANASFVRTDAFPSSKALLSWLPNRLELDYKNAVLAFDTSALLAPYETGSKSLPEIRQKYESLVRERRLLIPAQVAREYVHQRSQKLQNLHEQVSKKLQEAGSISIASSPLLDGLEEYQAIQKAEQELTASLKVYRESIKKLLSVIQAWNWNDPVSEIYRGIFTDETVVECEGGRDAILGEFADRRSKKIPPGYKDGNKEENDIGDYVIWKTILQIGAERKCPLVFVSNDRKPDWWCRASGQPLYPRFELLDEYRRASNGSTLHIVTFSGFLELAGASAAVIEEAKADETASATARRPEPNDQPLPPRLGFAEFAMHLAMAWAGRHFDLLRDVPPSLQPWVDAVARHDGKLWALIVVSVNQETPASDGLFFVATGSTRIGPDLRREIEHLWFIVACELQETANELWLRSRTFQSSTRRITIGFISDSEFCPVRGGPTIHPL